MSERGGAPATQPVSPAPTSSYPAVNDPGATWAWLVPSAQDLPPLALTHTTYKVSQLLNCAHPSRHIDATLHNGPAVN